MSRFFLKGGGHSSNHIDIIQPAYADRFVAEMQKTAAVNPVGTETVSIIEKYNPNHWKGAVYRNGYVYIIQSHWIHSFKIDIESDSIIDLSGETINNAKYNPAILSADNQIYCIPGSDSVVQKISATDNISSFGSWTWNCMSAVLACTGAIYASNESHEGQIHKIHNDSISHINISTEPSNCLALSIDIATGYVYAIPRYGSCFKINPFNDSVTSTSFGYVGFSYECWKKASAHSINGRYIYFFPRHQGASTYPYTIIKIDTQTDSLTYLSFVNGFTTSSAVLAPNGYIYCAPNSSSAPRYIARINTYTDVIDHIPLPYSGGWYSGALAPNGKIYFAPYTPDSHVLVIDTKQKKPLPHAFYECAYLNGG